jgi:hypothetical protein
MRKKLERRLTKNKYRSVVKRKSSGLWVSMSNGDILKLVDYFVRSEEKEVDLHSRDVFVSQQYQ